MEDQGKAVASDEGWPTQPFATQLGHHLWKARGVACAMLLHVQGRRQKVAGKRRPNKPRRLSTTKKISGNDRRLESQGLKKAAEIGHGSSSPL